MSKCFCHFNGYEVKDATARNDIEGLYKTKVSQEDLNKESSNIISYINNETSDLNNRISQMNTITPEVVNSIEEMIDTSKIYVNTSDGKWYYYKDSAWIVGGTYQSTGIGENTITEDMINITLKTSLKRRIDEKDVLYKNKENKLSITSSEYVNKRLSTSTGLEYEDNTNAVSTSGYIYFPIGANLKFDINSEFTYSSIYILYYDKDKNYLNKRKYQNGCSYEYPGASYIKYEVYKEGGLTGTECVSNLSCILTYEDKENNIKYEEGINKLDTSKSIEGFLSDSCDGRVFASSGYKTSGFMKIESGKKYRITKFRKLQFYDINYNAVSDNYVADETSNYVFTATINGFIRISYEDSYVNTLMVIEGDSELPYQSYIKYLPEDINIKQTFGNVLYGKKWVACGDSFTEGDFTNSLTGDYIFTEGLYQGEKKVYPFFIGRRNNMNIINEAKSGTSITNTGNGTDAFSINRYKNIPSDTDYITLWFGINDDNYGATIGTIDDNVNTTFYGAWNVVLEHLITNHPYAKIGIIITNGGNSTYNEVIRNVARKWGIPYLDLEKDYQVPLMLRVNEKTEVCDTVKNLRNSAFFVNNSTTTPNWHPNEKAHEYQSTFIENWLRSL